MKFIYTIVLMCIFLVINAQTASIKGQLQDESSQAVEFANIALFAATDSTLVKVETTNENGAFQLSNLNAGQYYLVASYVGATDLNKSDINLTDGQSLDVGTLAFGEAAVDLSEITVTATRALVEIKPDRTVFNVQGTINSAGSDAIELLRKAPSVTVDNNDNINVLGRSGVLLYVDGKRLPLSGEELSNYLKNLPAEQIDRIDIITSPGAKYEAEGNAGIIDIRLKKNENFGTNGTLTGAISKGEHIQMNGSASANYRGEKINVFGSIGASDNERCNTINFDTYQNGLFLEEKTLMQHRSNGYNFRLGTDYFMNDNHTIGVLISGNVNDGDNEVLNTFNISNTQTISGIDSFLVATTDGFTDANQMTYNINYRFDNKKSRTINIDADYGNYVNGNNRIQPNSYYKDAEYQQLSSQYIYASDTPTEIDIYTFKVDYEEEVLGGKLGLGTKLSRVISDNTFLFFNQINGSNIQNDFRSNRFDYEENVYAGYVSFSRPINEAWSFSAGLRAEQTDAVGNLEAFLPELQEPPVSFNYLSWFPNAGLTWQVAREHVLSLNYGRRINRPDYNVLNPFNNQISELSYMTGNPFLRPEIVNNIELGYTLKYRYNFKLSYSLTEDQITRLIRPYDIDPRAGAITWDNLATQEVWNFNVSAPIQVNEKWNMFTNFGAGYVNNQADYGDGNIVDVQAFPFSIYQQHTFDLPAKMKGEVSGYFSGPGVWGGVFEYESNWALNIGLQRKFFNDKLNAKLSFNDIFGTQGWRGVSSFAGSTSSGNGNWDSRRLGLSLSYNFGNEKVKSRKRKTGLEEEAKRVGNE